MLKFKHKQPRVLIEAEVNFLNFGDGYLENEFQDYECSKTGALIAPGQPIGYEVAGRLVLGKGVRYAHSPRTAPLRGAR